MAVIRTHKTKNFTTMSNVHLRDKRMSLKAKGLLSMFLSLPDDWVYSIGGLVSICKEGETSIKSTLGELKDLGYVKVTKILPEKGNGRIRYEYDIFETPTELQEGGFLGVEVLGVELLGVEVQPLENNPYTKDLLVSTELPSTEEQTTHSQNQVNGNSDRLFDVDREPSVKELKAKQLDADIDTIIDYLNEVSGKSYPKNVREYRSHIGARLKEGHTVEECMSAIRKKTANVLGTKYEYMLDPDKLFKPKYFANALNLPEPYQTRGMSHSVPQGKDMFDGYATQQ